MEQQRLAREEMSDQAGSEEEREEAAGEELQEEADRKPRREKAGIMPVLTIVVIAVALAGIGVCGFIFYRSYRREQERKRRRAEIMARHRARRAADN